MCVSFRFLISRDRSHGYVRFAQEIIFRLLQLRIILLFYVNLRMALDVWIYFNYKILFGELEEKERRGGGEINANLIFITAENHGLTLKFQ